MMLHANAALSWSGRRVLAERVVIGGWTPSTRKLHKRLHTLRTLGQEQVDLNEKAPTCGAFAEPSDGLEPSTPPYHQEVVCCRGLPGVAKSPV